MKTAPNTEPVAVILRYPGGESVLHPSAVEFASQVAASPGSANLSRSEALAVALRQHALESGATVSGQAITDAVSTIQRLRRTGGVEHVVLYTTTPPSSNSLRNMSSPIRSLSALDDTLDHFEVVRRFPNTNAAVLYEALAGLDEHKRELLTELELLLYPDRVGQWSRKHHGSIISATAFLLHRTPLIIFQGDVGTGKTALAETVGHALAQSMWQGRAKPNDHTYLLKLTTHVRGSGLVGEMSKLISGAFDEAEAFAQRHSGSPVLLLLDEADALASSRESAQMHHEDRAGLNTLIQRLDNLRLTPTRIATLFVTNRPGALDPAIRRRAALTLQFDRPDEAARQAILARRLQGTGITQQELQALVRITGPDASGNNGIPFTASDIADRLLGNALRKAYNIDTPLSFEVLAEAAQNLDPTPPFRESLQ